MGTYEGLFLTLEGVSYAVLLFYGHQAETLELWVYYSKLVYAQLLLCADEDYFVVV